MSLCGTSGNGGEREDGDGEAEEERQMHQRQISKHDELVQTDGARVAFASVKSASLQIEQILRRPLASERDPRILYGATDVKEIRKGNSFMGNDQK